MQIWRRSFSNQISSHDVSNAKITRIVDLKTNKLRISRGLEQGYVCNGRKRDRRARRVAKNLASGCVKMTTSWNILINGLGSCPGHRPTARFQNRTALFILVSPSTEYCSLSLSLSAWTLVRRLTAAKRFIIQTWNRKEYWGHPLGKFSRPVSGNWSLYAQLTEGNGTLC